MTKPCNHDAPRVRRVAGGVLPFVKGVDCHHCWHYETHAVLRQAWGGDAKTRRVVRAKPKAKAKPARISLPVRPPCVHEGPVVEACVSCGNKEERHVRLCAHPTADRDKCTRSHPTGQLQNCSTCPEYEPPDADVPFSSMDPLTLARMLKGPPPEQGWPVGWHTWEVTRKAHGIAADAMLLGLEAYPADRYSGRGVVIVGGGKYWPSVWVTVRMLRMTGCTLPVQVWYLGDAERDNRYRDILAPHGVEVINALSCREAKHTRGLTGFRDPDIRGGKERHPPFQAKSFAVLHSPFAQVLSLDADNYPVSDPTAIFEDSQFQSHGAAFWPDLPHTNAWTRWNEWGVEPFGPACGLEVGQYAIDKRACWEPLNLMRWYDDHGDWCYGWGAHHDHGDKGPPRVAFAKLRREYAMYAQRPTFTGPAFLQAGPDGRTPMFVHRCLSKFTLDDTGFHSTPQKAPNQRADLPGEDAAFGFLEELRRTLG